MNRLARYALAALALAAAPVLLMQGMANAQNPLSPMFARNGFNLALLSMGQLQVEQAGDGSVSMRVREGGVQLAQQAFAKEPLAGDALFVLAVNAREQGNEAAADSILDGAYALDKRNRNIGALQLQQAAVSGDIAQTLAIIDRLATVFPTLTNDFVQPLVQALAEPSAVPYLQNALENGPVWGEAFWLAVPRDAQRVGVMYELRQQTGNGTSAQSDAALLSQLAEQQLYGPAFALWEQISPQNDNPFRYVSDDAFPPFGWQLTASGERAMSNRGDGLFDIYVQGDTSGELARQLVRLPAGNYQFSSTVTPASEAENVDVKLECATGGSDAGVGQKLNQAARWTTGSSCEIYWLVLTGSAWDRSTAMRATISDMQFQAGS